MLTTRIGLTIAVSASLAAMLIVCEVVVRLQLMARRADPPPPAILRIAPCAPRLRRLLVRIDHGVARGRLHSDKRPVIAQASLEHYSQHQALFIAHIFFVWGSPTGDLLWCN